MTLCRNKICWHLVVVCACLISTAVNAQIVITSPINNQVSQRSLKDSASLAISGYAYYPYQSMEIRLEPKANSSVKPTIQNVSVTQLNQGFFRTTIKAKTGWYRMIITAIRSDGRQDTTSVSKVGVGEVFLVTGNSNAMGIPDLGPVVGASENVVSFDTVNKYLNNENITVAYDEPMRTPKFTQFKSKNFAYPAGETSWFWGELGDMLYNRYGTPVLFLNAGWAAASSISYREAASGKDTFNNYVGKYWPFRQPYSNIPNTLRYFNSYLGIRSILWSHGENDAYQVRIDQTSYFNNIQYLIQRTREDFGFNVPWVIGLSTVTRLENNPYPPVIEAQKALGTLKGFNTWLGPDSDTIQVPRPNHGHFENVVGGIQGLSLAAKAWNRNLSDAFFKSIEPVQPEFYIQTGAIPATVSPGSSFTIPFSVSENLSRPSSFRAELLAKNGNFVVLLGSGSASPLKVVIPSGVLNGSYRIRIVATNPIVVGTVSDLIEIDRKYNSIGYIRELTTEQKADKIQLSWMVTANPGIKSITLQKSADYNSFIDLETFAALDNQLNSRVYAHTDTDDSKASIYYRIRMAYTDGPTKYAGGLVIFRENLPPGFVVFPNPTPDQYFFLRRDTPGEEFSISLFDLSGHEHTVVTDDNQVAGLTQVKPAYSVSAGAYILKIKTGSTVTTQRVIFR